MKKRKLILPSIALAIVAAFGLAACGGSSNNSGGQSQNQGSSEPQSLGEITITAEGKTDLIVGETVQLRASVEGVTWKSRSDAVATVDANGLVTAVGAGSVKIRAEKDNYDTGSITITVSKAPEKEAHTIIDLEHADHYSPTDIWGMDLSAYGMGFMGPGDSPVEDNSGATEDGHSLGWLQQGCKETLTFTSNKAVEVEIGISMAYNAEMNLASALSVKFNNNAIDMTGKVCEGPEDGDNNNYYDWHTTSFGKVNLIQGNNVLEIEMIGQGPNMDVLKIYSDDKALQIAVVDPVAKPKIEVTPAEVEIFVGDTQQLTTTAQGVTYTSADPTVASVSETGLVTGLKQGQTSITVEKEGMKKATVSVKVTNKPVAGQIVLEAEEATLSEGAQVENDNNASGTKSVGYLSDGLSITFTYNATEAKEMKLSVVGSSALMSWDNYPTIVVSDQSLADSMTLSFNDAAIDLTGKVFEGSDSASMSNFRLWHEVDLGNVNLKVGENKFVITAIGQGPNIDCLKLTDPNAQQGGQENPPAVTKYNVTFNANGGSGEMAAVEVEEGSEYTLPACAFTAPAGRVFAGWDHTVQINQWQSTTTTYQAGDKVTVSADMAFTAHWSYQKDTPVDLTSAYYAEAEAAELAGGAKVEAKDDAHGGKSVGYMSAGASITLQFHASAAGKATLILLASSASANWNVQPVQYYDQDLASTTSIKVNGVDVDLTGKGLNGADAPAFSQVNLGEFDVVAGNNTIVISAIAQSCNIDAIAVVSSLTLSDPLPPAGLMFAELEDATFERLEGQTAEDTLTVVDQADAHGGKAVTNFKQGSKVTVRINASAAGKVGLKLICASTYVQNAWGNDYMFSQTIADALSVKVNSNAVDLTGKKIGSDWSQVNYFDWTTLDLGEIDVQLGENVIVLEALNEFAPNLDALRIQGSETLTVTVL